MRARLVKLLAIASIGAFTACGGGGTAIVPSAPQAPVQPQSPTTTLTAANTMESCATPLPGDDARCFAAFRIDVGGGMSSGYHGAFGLDAAPEDLAAFPAARNATPAGYGPSQLQSAYKLPSSTAGNGQTIAIVDAYDDPTAANDLTVYRNQYGLPACTIANGCFKKVSQTGSTSKFPAKNGGWAQEESLDLDMVSATCPNCRIILVEATTASFANLGSAVNEAVALGADVVSNSYGGAEQNASNSAYAHAGTIVTASAGDSGTGAQQPCSYATVVCTGGTTLTTAADARGWRETAWSGSGSGCSALVAKPAWQTDKGCTKRSESDVSFDANPNTGVAVYDSTAYGGAKGWLVFGGTSVASPAIAGIYGLAGNARSLNAAQSIWQNAGAGTFDVTSGSNGTCSISYICHAGVGYDGPTGWGTPNGTAAL